MTIPTNSTDRLGHDIRNTTTSLKFGIKRIKNDEIRLEALKCVLRIEQAFAKFQMESNKKMKKIFIDVGHGGDDNGAVWGEGFDYVEEDDLNLIISFLLKYELQLTGFEVRLSRSRDRFVKLSERVKMANEWKADVFISIHADAFHNKTVKGISTHVYQHCSKKALEFAIKVQHELTTRFIKHTNRGVKRSNFHVLRETTMPAILVECEFISNPEMRRFLKEPENQIELAKAIARGVS